MRPIEPGVVTQCSRRGVLTNAGQEGIAIAGRGSTKRRVDYVFKGAGLPSGALIR